MPYLTHWLFIIGKDVTRLPFTNLPCHPLSVGIGKDEVAFWKNWRIHLLPVHHRKRFDQISFKNVVQYCSHPFTIGRDLIRFPSQKCAYLLFDMRKHVLKWTFQQHVQHHSLSVHHRKRVRNMYNKVTHLLLTMGINVMRIPLKMFSSSHSLAVGGGKKLMSLPIGTENAICSLAVGKRWGFA